MAEKENLFYAAMLEGEIAGVYSAKENVPEGAELLEIMPLCLEGSPRSEKYVCMAKGTWSVTRCDDGQFSSNVIDLEPIWGSNAQSAIAGLLRHNLVRRDVEVTELVLYEINKTYAADEAENLHKAAPFRALTKSITENCRVTPEELAADFISEYFEAKRMQQEREEKRRKTKVSLTSLRLITLLEREKYAALNAWQKPRCGRHSEGRKKATESALMNLFSTEELISLAEILEDLPEKTLPEMLSELKNEDCSKAQLLERAVEIAKTAGKI